MRVPVHVGLELHVKWHKEQFSGITKYCRQDGAEYILGVQRVSSLSIVPPAIVPQTIEPTAVVSQTVIARTIAPTVAPEGIVPDRSKAAVSGSAQEAPPQQPTSRREPVASVPDPPPKPLAPKLADPPPMHSRAVDREPPREVKSHARRFKQQGRVRQTDVQTRAYPKVQERTAMLEKWINRGAGRRPQEAANENLNGQFASKERMNMHSETPTAKYPVANTNTNSNGKGTAGFQGDLLSLEDIYRAAGIMNLRLGYSINTVIEMLNSDHMRGLPNEVKRAAVLMALETAGMPIAEVLEDAAQRHEAINSYEATQQKHVEEYEGRKIEENDQIQAEIERITAQLQDRMKLNLDEVIAVKDTFRHWQQLKQKESQRIAEATSLCEKNLPSPTSPADRVDSVVALQAAGFVTKP